MLRNFDPPAAVDGASTTPCLGSALMQSNPQALQKQDSMSEERSNANAGTKYVIRRTRPSSSLTS